MTSFTAASGPLDDTRRAFELLAVERALIYLIYLVERAGVADDPRSEEW